MTSNALIVPLPGAPGGSKGFIAAVTAAVSTTAAEAG
jgi:hypothetical protein